MIADFQEKIENGLSKLHFGDEPRELYEPISYLLSLGGKRMRPLLVLLGHEMGQSYDTLALPPALAVEVFHNFTLMHDDIMDEAPLRRGKPTVHHKWSSPVAILSGDTMLVKAYELMLNVPSLLLAESLRGFNQCAVEVCEGQQIDMNFESRDAVTEAEYLEMIRLKTAVLLGFSLKLGARLANVEEEKSQSLYDIGVDMGIGFQLMDDLLDVYADKAKFGKQVGGDIVSNKKTFLLIKAQELAKGKQKEALNQWVMAREFDPTAKVAGVRGIYDDLGIHELTTLKMNAYFDKALAQLESLEVREEGKQALRMLALSLMKRES